MEVPDLSGMDGEELRELAATLMAAVEQNDVEREQILKESQWKDLKISQLTHEMAVLKRWRLGRGAEEGISQRSCASPNVRALNPALRAAYRKNLKQYRH